jgi:uncharacterized protein
MMSSAGDERAVRIAAFLDAHRVMSLATSGPRGPHAANVFYARDDFTLLWVSSPDSEHSRHLVARPRVAATIAADCLDYADIKGVQIHGDAWRIDQRAERSRARALLELRFDFLRRIKFGSSALHEAYENAEFYRLEPSRIVLIDNSRGFGFKEALDFDTVYAERTH